MSDLLRQLPSMQALLESEQAEELIKNYSHPEVVSALRERLQRVRDKVRSGELSVPTEFEVTAILSGIDNCIEKQRQANLRPVINATGIIIHTNLGRAPLAQEALEAIQSAAESYSNLELDLATGKRGSRYAHVEELICKLTGAEAAIVVNNCAAAVLVSLSGLASGREVVAARGELIEIGGSFRLPDVIEQSGALLKEVGATNKVRLSDYKAAIHDETAVLLKSHTSNFRVIGFTSKPSRSELAELAREHGLILMEDLGSGVLIDLMEYGLPDEPVVGDILKEGVDIVMFSGDKLLGGPQAGIIAGRKAVVNQLRTHPLLRAIRIDKLSLAALEATLRLYLAPQDPIEKIPVLNAFAESIDEIQTRAESLANAIQREGLITVEVVESAAYAGGGSLPQQDLSSFAVALKAESISATTFASRLRCTDTPVVGRIKDEQLLLDMRAVSDAELPNIAQSVFQALTV